MAQNNDVPNITLIGAGTIGLSFAVFHLTHLPSPSHLTIYDTRSALQDHILSILPQFYTDQDKLPDFSKIKTATSLRDAVQNASIIQESGPENLAFKQNLWKEVEELASEDALFWSSTSGIPASKQSSTMKDPCRVIVVHPYNPPHIMPLLELVPSPHTSPSVISRTQDFWSARGRVPVLINKETTGFVANRLAFALLREAIHLVNEGVVGVEEVDRIVESSMGPRWAVAGPFKSYHAGGGTGALEGFFKNIGRTVQDCWADAGRVDVGGRWEERVFTEAREAYGIVDVGERDRVTKRVLGAVKGESAGQVDKIGE